MDAQGQCLVDDMMFLLHTWFFSIETLQFIADYTNDKATEIVYKTRHTRIDEDGEEVVYYKVTPTHTHSHTHTRTR